MAPTDGNVDGTLSDSGQVTGLADDAEGGSNTFPLISVGIWDAVKEKAETTKNLAFYLNQSEMGDFHTPNSLLYFLKSMP